MQLKDANCGPLDRKFFDYNLAVARSGSFINARDVCSRHKLEPGTYCIIPSTYDAGEEGDFLLRVYTEKPVSSRCFSVYFFLVFLLINTSFSVLVYSVSLPLLITGLFFLVFMHQYQFETQHNSKSSDDRTHLEI